MTLTGLQSDRTANSEFGLNCNFLSTLGNDCDGTATAGGVVTTLSLLLFHPQITCSFFLLTFRAGNFPNFLATATTDRDRKKFSYAYRRVSFYVTCLKRRKNYLPKTFFILLRLFFSHVYFTENWFYPAFRLVL